MQTFASAWKVSAKSGARFTTSRSPLVEEFKRPRMRYAGLDPFRTRASKLLALPNGWPSASEHAVLTRPAG